MSLPKRSGILSLLAASTISLTAMADTQTERPNRPPEDNPYLDCPEGVVDVVEDEEGMYVYFNDGYVYISSPSSGGKSDMFYYFLPDMFGHDFDGRYPCPEEAWQEQNVLRSLEDRHEREETVKSEAGQQVLETPAGQAWYDSLHTWMQQQVDQWTNEWKAENSTQSSSEMENTGQSVEPDPFDTAYQREMHWHGLIMEYSSGYDSDGDFNDMSFSEEVDEDPAFGLPSF